MKGEEKGSFSSWNGEIVTSQWSSLRQAVVTSAWDWYVLTPGVCRRSAGIADNKKNGGGKTPRDLNHVSEGESCEKMDVSSERNRLLLGKDLSVSLAQRTNLTLSEWMEAPEGGSDVLIQEIGYELLERDNRSEKVTWGKTASVFRSVSFPCDWEKQSSTFYANSEMEFVI